MVSNSTKANTASSATPSLEPEREWRWVRQGMDIYRCRSNDRQRDVALKHFQTSTHLSGPSVLSKVPVAWIENAVPVLAVGLNRHARSTIEQRGVKIRLQFGQDPWDFVPRVGRPDSPAPGSKQSQPGDSRSQWVQCNRRKRAFVPESRSLSPLVCNYIYKYE